MRNLKSDCYYGDLEISTTKQLENLQSLAFSKNITIVDFEPDYSFNKSKYDYTDEELLQDLNIDFSVNRTTCGKRIITLDGWMYFCPGFIELKEPVMHISEYTEEGFKKRVYELYTKPLFMCIGKTLTDIKRFCPVKDRCDKTMCHYLNKKITGDSRFPFSDFCKIKEKKYSTKMKVDKADVLMILLNSLAKLNEAILSLGTANPNPVIKNRLQQIVNEVNQNIETVLERIKGE